MKLVYSWLDLLQPQKNLPKAKMPVTALPFVALSVGLYIAACASPALIMSGGSWTGLQLLSNGLLGIFKLQFGWFANIFLLLSVCAVFFENWRGVRNYSLIALLIGLQSLMLFKTNISFDGPESAQVLGFDYGFFLWLNSFLPMFFLGLMRCRSSWLNRHYGAVVVHR